MNKLKFPCLVRDYIHESLYSSTSGYFMKDSHQLGSLPEPLKYSSFKGIYNYTQMLGKNYPKNAFLTPVEIFQPWYGHALANYCIQKQSSASLRILEIGGGTGTCALSILDFLKNNSSRHYNSIHYTICEISPVLSKTCEKRLLSAHPFLVNSGQLKVFNKSALDWNTLINDQVFIIGLEVLDNFSHDRVWKKNGKWSLQTRVTEGLTEVLEDINDGLIKECLEAYERMPPKNESEIEAEHKEGIFYNLLQYWFRLKDPESMFLPTAAYGFMKNVKKFIAEPHFLLADFDSLPSNKFKALNAPIVSRKGTLSHEAQDYDTYLGNFGEVDIFFPVNFRLLQQFYREIYGKSGTVLKSYKFMEEYAKVNWTQLDTGYRPLFDDFRNTSFFLSN